MLGHPATFVGVKVSVTIPVVPGIGVQSTNCGVLAGAVAVPSIPALLKFPPAEELQFPVNVSVT